MLDEFRFRRGPLPLVLATLLASVTKSLDIVQARLSQMEVAGLDEVEIVVVRPKSQPALRTRYRNWSVLLSAVRLAEPKLGINQSKSEKKGTVYAQKTLKNRKKATSPPGKKRIKAPWM